MLQAEATAMGNEIAVARAFAATVCGEWRYDAIAQEWYQFDTAAGVWRKDVMHRIRYVAREYVRQLPGAKPATQSNRFLRNIIEIASSDPLIAFNGVLWDASPSVLGTPGGIYDLRTGERIQGGADLNVSRQTATAPSDRSESPKKWLAFLDQAMEGDRELIGFVQRWAGYCATGDTKEHKFLWALGAGGAGSSVAQETIAYCLGEYATTAPVEAFAVVRGERHPTELAALAGARMVTVSEFGKGTPPDETRVKGWVSADRQSARHIRGNPFNFTPCGKLWITSNSAPNFLSVDRGISRRLLLLPFSRPAAAIDLDLGMKLKAEAAAILRWVLEGAAMWYAGGLNPPSILLDGVRTYFDEEDTFALFLSECCDLGPELRVASSALFASWQRFCRARNESSGTAKSFGHQVRAKGFVPTQNAGRHNCRGYIGLTLKPVIDTHDTYPSL